MTPTDSPAAQAGRALFRGFHPRRAHRAPLYADRHPDGQHAVFQHDAQSATAPYRPAFLATAPGMLVMPPISIATNALSIGANPMKGSIVAVIEADQKPGHGAERGAYREGEDDHPVRVDARIERTEQIVGNRSDAEADLRLLQDELQQHKHDAGSGEDDEVAVDEDDRPDTGSDG